MQHDVVVEQRQPVASEHAAVREERTAGAGLRVFQALAAIAGGILFVMGLIAIFDVNFSDNLLDTSATVAGFGFSAAAAIAALAVGGAILAVSLADQDRGSTALMGLVSMALGIAALIAEGQAAEDIALDRGTAALFLVIGAAVFVLSLVPWWSGRRTVTRVAR